MSRTFKDAAGREWSLAIDAPNLRRVRTTLNACPLDILDPVKSQGWLDPVRIVDALFVLVKPAADAAGVTDEDFGRSLAGDVYEAATAALMNAVIDYLPKAKGEAFRAAFERLAAADQAAFEKACDAVSRAADETMAKLSA